MAAYFEIHEAPDGEWLRLRLVGELDLGSAPALRQRLAQLRAAKRPARLDLSGLEFMDSTGIHLLTGAFNHARKDGWQLAIEPALAPQVDRLVKLAGLDRLIPELRRERPVPRVSRPTASGSHAPAHSV
jgi:anti-sigma B factor antagonist